jgi:hypothetical protein
LIWTKGSGRGQCTNLFTCDNVVSAFDYETPIQVVASYEEEVFVLRPVGIPGVEVTRRLDADGHMVWTRPDLGGLVVTRERLGGVEHV